MQAVASGMRGVDQWGGHPHRQQKSWQGLRPIAAGRERKSDIAVSIAAYELAEPDMALDASRGTLSWL